MSSSPGSAKVRRGGSRSRRSGGRPPLLSWGLSLGLPLATLGILLLVGHRAPIPGHPWLLLLLTATTALGATFRPWWKEEGEGLGLGALALPVTVPLLGPSATGWVALLARPLADTLRFLFRRKPSWGRLPAAACRDALAALAGAGCWVAVRELGPVESWALAGLAYLAVQTALGALLRRLHRDAAPPVGRALVGVGVELSAWFLGAVTVEAWLDRAADPAFLWLPAIGLLALEAARQRARRRGAEESRSALLDLGVAGHRMALSVPGMEEIAQRVFIECRRVVPGRWVELSLDRPTVEGDSVWHLGPNGPVRPGPASPPDHPPPRPGVHRRVRWQRIEHRLESGDELLGALRIWCDPREIDRESKDLLASLLPQLASLVHRARLDEEASRDPLTGAVLRRVLDETLTTAFSRARSSGESLSVVLVDMDFFKRINDQWGHPAGDLALRSVAEVLLRNLRDRDLCARYGGEEFTLLLEGLDGEASLAVAERLRYQVETLEVDYRGDELPLSLSAGVASFPEVHCRKAEELVELADAALYEAKRLGRNCCLLHRGRGRFEDPRGRIVETREDADASQDLPRLFV